jgi:hypothetical protein
MVAVNVVTSTLQSGYSLSRAGGRTFKGMFLKALVVAAVIVGGVTAPANAVDQRPCVSKAEYYGLKSGQTQAQVEARWEVADVGSTAGGGPYRYFIDYPLCGDVGTVTMGYQRDSHLWATALATIPERHNHTGVSPWRASDR